MNETVIPMINIVTQNGAALISTIDPNWLYSSIAQSSAAIVGLMGAFLTTKLITKKSVIKGLETQIRDNKAKIEFLKGKVAEKENWVKKIDDEEDLINVKQFLKEISDEIEVDAPPSIEELVKMAKDSKNEDFHNLNWAVLENSYNKEYLEKVRAKQDGKKFPLDLGMLHLSELNWSINPQITSLKWARYGQYNDEISATYTEIKYIEGTIKTKENELQIEKAGVDLNKTFMNLAFFSLVGVFLPLTMLSLSLETMYSFRFPIVVAVLIAWGIILAYLITEIKGLKNTIGEGKQNA